ncbi:MAG TPA: HD domain-containing protein [Candidatus Hydrogenedentes bacterium]|nr:HD domain-containing protein [Candidatus Hydrogenedentota bacterium]
MKKQFVATLQEDDVVNTYFVATRCDLRDQANGKKFLGMAFRDRTGEVGGIMWNNAVAASQLFEAGDVVNVRGKVTSYQGRLQVRVEQVLPLKEGEYSYDDLVFTPTDTEETLAKFRAVLETIQNEWLTRLVKSFLDDAEFMEAFATAAAGRKWHHAYRGGLLKHCYEVVRIAETACELFPNVDRDVLLAAVFLHDIGKIDEMSRDMFVDYTNAGRLLGHLQIGAETVQKRIETIDEFPENLRLQLLHCILSHHGELVNGSPIVPKTLEAIVLHIADNLDAQADAFTRVVEETKGKGRQWSEYIQLIDRQIWTKRE